MYFPDKRTNRINNSIVSSIINDPDYDTSSISQDDIDVSTENWGPKKGEPVSASNFSLYNNENNNYMKNDKHHASKEVSNRETFNLPKDDVDTLNENRWLSATIVDWGIAYYVQELRTSECTVGSWDQFFPRQLAFGRHMKAIEKAIFNNYTSFDWLIGSINTDTTGPGSHWIFVIVNMHSSTIYILNSLFKTTSLSCEILDLLKNFILVLASTNNLIASIEKWTVEYVKDSPQQPNFDDCGLYCILLAKSFITGVDAFSGDNNLHFKRQELKRLASKPQIRKTSNNRNTNLDIKIQKTFNANRRKNWNHKLSVTSKACYSDILQLYTK